MKKKKRLVCLPSFNYQIPFDIGVVTTTTTSTTAVCVSLNYLLGGYVFVSGMCLVSLLKIENSPLALLVGALLFFLCIGARARVCVCEIKYLQCVNFIRDER